MSSNVVHIDNSSLQQSVNITNGEVVVVMKRSLLDKLYEVASHYVISCLLKFCGKGTCL